VTPSRPAAQPHRERRGADIAVDNGTFWTSLDGQQHSDPGHRAVDINGFDHSQFTECAP
jgi:hypothetical protein